MNEQIKNGMGDKRWIGPGNAETKCNDGLGRFHFQSSHFEASYVLTGRDDCGGNYIPQPSWPSNSSYCNKRGNDKQFATEEYPIVGALWVSLR